MTQQFSDIFSYEGDQLEIIGINGEKLTTPIDFGIKTRAASTGCWRGYIMRYEIKDNQLFMEGCWLRTLEGEIPPKINDSSPLKITRESDPRWPYSLGFNYFYSEAYLKQQFTGALLLASNPIEEEYVHMGYPSATSFRTVLRFDFKDGSVIKIEDISEKIEEAREQGDPKGYYPETDSPEEIKKWVANRFSLKSEFLE